MTRAFRRSLGSAAAYPNAATTGPAAGGYTSLTGVSAADYNIYAASPGSWPAWVQTLGDGSQLVEGIAFAAGTTIYTDVPTIAFTGCQLLCAPASRAITSGGATVTLSYCTICPQDTSPLSRIQQCIDGDAVTGSINIDYCNFWGWEQAVHTGDAAVTVTASYIHDPGYYGGDHTECFEMPGGAQLTVTSSTLLNSQNQTAVVAAGTSPASYTVSDCFIGGGGYTFYSYSAASNIVITGNRFTTAYFPNSGYYGPFANPPTWGSSGNVWAGNTWYDGPSAGQALAAP